MAAAGNVLIHDIWRDLKKHILIYILLLLVVISAFSVIYFTHLNRQTTSQLELLLTDRDELDIEFTFQSFLNDLHVEKAQKTATKTKT